MFAKIHQVGGLRDDRSKTKAKRSETFCDYMLLYRIIEVFNTE